MLLWMRDEFGKWNVCGKEITDINSIDMRRENGTRGLKIFCQSISIELIGRQQVVVNEWVKEEDLHGKYKQNGYSLNEK